MNGHLRQRTPGSWELRYRVGNKTRTATVRGTKREAERELRRLLSLVDQNRHPTDPDRLTLGEWLQRWLAQVRLEIAPRTYEQYESGVRVHIIPAIGHLPINRLGPADVQAFYTALAKTKLKASSRLGVCTLLGSALARAVEQRLIVTSPTEPLRKRLPRPEKAKMVVLDAAQCAQLLSRARGQDDLYVAILLALSTGMRRSEILALRWGNVDLDEGEILVAESVEHIRGNTRIKAPKSGESRIVTIPDQVVVELRRVKREQAEWLLRLGVRQDGETRVCTRPDGTVYNPNAMTEAFRVFLRRTGLPVCRFHDLRHSHASQLLQLGVSVRVAADRLGHSDGGALLLKTYAHGDATMHREAAQRLGTLFGRL